MAESVRIEAPTYIRSLCVQFGYEFPPAVYSKADAGEIIDALKAGDYDPRDFCPSHLVSEYASSEEWTDDYPF